VRQEGRGQREKERKRYGKRGKKSKKLAVNQIQGYTGI
jgi:hypothetical protein